MIKKMSYREPKGKPKQLVVFLHGMGSNKDDLITLSEEFAEVLPDALFVSPNAIHKCGFMPNAYQWFSLEDNNIDRIEKEVNSSVEILNTFIDEILEEYNISPENLYLIGFSQGATISIYSSLKREVPVKAVLAYSGMIFNDLEPNITKPKVIGLIHGKLDDIVNFSFHKGNLKHLKKINANVKELAMDRAYHEIPLEAVEFGKKIICEK